MGSCDFVRTKWTIDCSTSTQACVYLTDMGLGLRARDVYIENSSMNVKHTKDSMEKICDTYTNDDTSWIIDKYWEVGVVANYCVIVVGILLLFVLVGTSCMKYGKQFIKILSILFICTSLLNIVPLLLIPFNSEVCQSDIKCNHHETACINSTCEFGNAFYHMIVASILWLSAAVTTVHITSIKNYQFNSDEEVGDFEIDKEMCDEIGVVATESESHDSDEFDDEWKTVESGIDVFEREIKYLASNSLSNGSGEKKKNIIDFGKENDIGQL